MKRSLPFLALLLLLVSCSSRTETLALSSSVGSEIYVRNRKQASVIVLDKKTMASLIGENGRDIAGIMTAIYGGKTIYVDDAAYEERQSLYGTLIRETGTENLLALWERDGKRLEDTQLVSYLDKRTNGFESALRELLKKGSMETSVYSASDVLGENCSYESAIVFLKRWIKAIIG